MHFRFIYRIVFKSIKKDAENKPKQLIQTGFSVEIATSSAAPQKYFVPSPVL